MNRLMQMIGMFVKKNTPARSKYEIYDVKLKKIVAGFDDLDTAQAYYLHFDLSEYPLELIIND